MVEVERIIIKSFVFIFLLENEKHPDKKVSWMFSINGCGTCGRAGTDIEAFNEILKLSKVSGDIKTEIERVKENRISGIKTNIVITDKQKRSIQLDLF